MVFVLSNIEHVLKEKQSTIGRQRPLHGTRVLPPLRGRTGQDVQRDGKMGNDPVP